MTEHYSQQQLNNFCIKHKIVKDNFIQNYRNVYYPLIKKICNERQQHAPEKVFFIGINAPQGAGKTTLCSLMQEVLLCEFNLNSVALSLDDFYKPRDERMVFARQNHPLFTTRGVPGTHDVQLAINTIQSLVRLKPGDRTTIPRFDKSADDRSNQNNWTQIKKPVDIVLLEGWCLGAEPQSEQELLAPINSLEQEEDINASWRSQINSQLAGIYQELFSLMDFWIYFKPPTFGTVCAWRQEQELKLRKTLEQQNLAKDKTMDNKQLSRFMMYFERITLGCINTMPKLADLVVELDAKRNGKITKSN